MTVINKMIFEENKICCDQCSHKTVCKNKVRFKGILEAVRAVEDINYFDDLHIDITCNCFSDDEKTVDLISLIRQKLEEDGYAGIIITVPKDGCAGPNCVELIKTLDGADKAICGLYTSDEERMAKNEPYDKN